jgi:hypothetical protein
MRSPRVYPHRYTQFEGAGIDVRKIHFFDEFGTDRRQASDECHLLA